MKPLFPVLALSVLFAGCAGLSGASVDELRGVSNDNLCAAYFQKRTMPLRQVLFERDAVQTHPEYHWTNIDYHEVKIGFTETELLCSRGLPTRMNRGSHGNQWIYHNPFTKQTEYFYTDGKYVTGWN